MEAISTGKKPTKVTMEKLIEAKNIAEFLTKEELGALGKQVVADYHKDKSTRSDWELRHAKAIKLALQITEAKSFPWVNCSNVKFPSLTIAALQFLARVSLMTKGKKLAKVEVIGNDIDGQKSRQAKRISSHMSLQLTEEDPNWTNSDETAKLACCLVGSTFKKTYYDPVQGINISEHVPAMNFVVDYNTKDIDKAQRATHLIPLSGNDLLERERRGVFLKMSEEDKTTGSSIEANLLKIEADNAAGIHPEGGLSDGMYDILEQYRWEDYDGDGYKEPYIVSVRQDTEQVLRIVARYSDVGDVHRLNDLEVLKLDQKASQETDMKKKSELEKTANALQNSPSNVIIRIDPQLFFTRLVFVPSPDGGIYGLGLGALIGPITEAIDAMLNQLIDAGTMSNTAGGFLGRGVRMKAGKNSFDPFEWKPVDSPGTDLAKNIFPLPVREPSAVLFQLLGLLITYSEKISSSTDIMTGVSPGQNTPAETSRNTVEQGMMLFSGIYARLHRSFTEELRKVYKLNTLFLKRSPRWYELTEGGNAILAPDDYDKNTFRIFPSASPESVSLSQKKEKATMVHQLASTESGFNRYLVTRDLLEAWEIEDIDLKFPDPQSEKAVPPPVNPKVEQDKAELALKQKVHEDEMQLEMLAMEKELALDKAKIEELEAKAKKFLAEAEGVSTGHEIAMLEAQIGAARAHQDAIHKALTLMQKQKEHGAKMKEGAAATAGATSKAAQVEK